LLLGQGSLRRLQPAVQPGAVNASYVEPEALGQGGHGAGHADRTLGITLGGGEADDGTPVVARVVQAARAGGGRGESEVVDVEARVVTTAAGAAGATAQAPAGSAQAVESALPAPRASVREAAPEDFDLVG
jgi:hypothetical protein